MAGAAAPAGGPLAAASAADAPRPLGVAAAPDASATAPALLEFTLGGGDLGVLGCCDVPVVALRPVPLAEPATSLPVALNHCVVPTALGDGAAHEHGRLASAG